MTVRPTAAERIAAIRETLARVVAPEVSSPYAADILALCLAQLGGLADAAAQTDAELADEVDGIEALLAAADAGIRPDPEFASFRDTERRTLQARAALAEVVRERCFRPGSEELDRAIGAHLRRAAERLPPGYRQPR